MNRFLILDIGAGTLDVLFFEAESGLHYKAVVRSPVLTVSEKVASLPGGLVVTGCEMGGGALWQTLRERAQHAEVIMSRSAAMTVHHDVERLLSAGIKLVEDVEAESLSKDPKLHHLRTGDIEPERLKSIVEGFGAPFDFDVVGICCQDHGTPPEGMSHLDFRHNIFKTFLDREPYPHALLYREDEVPPHFNRLRSVAKDARTLPAREIYVMDSGMAAILGASMDFSARSKEKILVLDVATSHTVGAALDKGELAGFFEYHTHDITLPRLESLLRELADGGLEHEAILREGGHGAYIRRAFGFSSVQLILATGPKRRMAEGSRLPIAFGSPLGDNMMTGTAGVLEAIRRRNGLKAIPYL